MASPAENLAKSLEKLDSLQQRGVIAVRSRDLTRTHRERLVKNGFLQQVMKGWYIPASPNDQPGDTSAWYANFWGFCAAYFEHRFGTKWSLPADRSLLLLTGSRTVPQQIAVHAEGAGNTRIDLIHGTSLVELRVGLPPEGSEVVEDGLRLYSLPAALVESGPSVFKQHPIDARVALAQISDASEVLGLLLEGGKSKVAGRLAGAFRNIGRNQIADRILSAMRAAGYTVVEVDPFEYEPELTLQMRAPSPYTNRLRIMWESMRNEVIAIFPRSPGIPNDVDSYLDQVDEIYVQDAYHSLSIENYRVTPELIEKIRSGDWNPDKDNGDNDNRNALAAKGYHEAFKAVKQSLHRTLKEENAGLVAEEDHSNWYQQLFAPSVTAGIVRPADLAGYRNDQVYIKGSRHTPPKREAVRDCMPILFELLKNEPEACVRAVLGHFGFVFVHPYMDGNGRMGRFLMNVMLGSGGYPWTVVPVDDRAEYMAALESASVEQEIRPFAEYLAGLVRARLEGEPVPAAPLHRKEATHA
jgi:hypothetical protein